MSKEAQDSYVAKPLRCHACAVRERAAKKFVNHPDDDAGLMFAIVAKANLTEAHDHR
jgi:hypothetical protein